MMQADLFAPPEMAPVAIEPNRHGVYDDAFAEKIAWHGRGQRWAGIELLHIEAGWLESAHVNLPEHGGGYGLSAKWGVHATRAEALAKACCWVGRYARHDKALAAWTEGVR